METPEEQWEGAMKMGMMLLGLGVAAHQSIAPTKKRYHHLTF